MPVKKVYRGAQILRGAYNTLKNLTKGGVGKARGVASAAKQAVTPGPVTKFTGKVLAGGAKALAAPTVITGGLTVGGLLGARELGLITPDTVAEDSKINLNLDDYSVSNKKLENYGLLKTIGSSILNLGVEGNPYSQENLAEKAAEMKRADITGDTTLSILRNDIATQANAIEAITGGDSRNVKEDGTVADEISRMRDGENKTEYEARLNRIYSTQDNALQLGRTGGGKGKELLKQLGPNATSGQIENAKQEAVDLDPQGDRQTIIRNQRIADENRLESARRYKDEQSLLLQKLIADSNNQQSQFAIQMAQQNYQNRALDMRDERDARRDRQQMLMQIMKGLSNVGQSLY